MAQRTKARKDTLREARRRGIALVVSLALAISSTPLPAFAEPGEQSETVPVEEVQETAQEQSDVVTQGDEAVEQPDQAAVPAEAEETPSQGQDDSSSEPALEAASAEDRGNPVSISFASGHKRTFIKEVTGDWAEVIIEGDGGQIETGEYFEYRMSIEEGDKLIVTYESGEVVTYTASETDLGGGLLAFLESKHNISEDSVLYIDDFAITSDQYENHWDVGAHQFVIVWNEWDLRATIDVEVVEDTLASISYEPASPIVYTEGLNGYQNTWSEDEPFFCYNEPKFEPGSVLTLTYNDGSSVRYVCEETDSYRTCFVNESDPTDIIMQGNGKMQVGTYGDQFSEPSSDSVWKLGAHNVWTIAYRGHTYDVPVELVANNLESISYEPVQPIELFEGTNGYSEDGWAYWYDYREGDVLTLTYSADDSSPEGKSHAYVYTLGTPKGDCFVWSDGDQSDYIVPPSMIDVRDGEYDSEADLVQSIEIDNDSCMKLSYRGRTAQIPATLHSRTMVNVAVSLADSTYAMGSQIAESGINRGYNVPMLDENDEIIVTYRDDLGNESVVTYVDADGEGSYRNANNPNDVLADYTIYGEGYNENLDWTGERWIVGEECCWYLSVNDMVAKVAVNVLSSGVSAIEYIPVEPLKYGLQENGWWDDYEDDYGEWNEYYVYILEPLEGDQLKVTDNDGSTATYTLVDSGEGLCFVAEGHEDIDYSDVRISRGYDEPHNEWQTGWHYFVVSYRDRQCQVPVAIGNVPDPVDLGDAGVSIAVQDQIYTGKPLTPEATVTLDGKALSVGEDYSIGYRDNVNAGTATVYITGRGPYAGEAKATFTIEPQSLGRNTSLITDWQSYTGAAQEPAFTLTNSSTGKRLAKGIDYEIVLDGEAIDVGEYHYDVVGKGNYTGSYADYCQVDYLSFEIHPVGLDDVDTVVEARIPDQIYSGEPIVPDFEFKVNDRVLTKDVDYTVDFENNVELGSANVTITGQGNYSGSYYTYFTIKVYDPYDGLPHGAWGDCTWYIRDEVMTVEPTNGTTGTIDTSLPWGVTKEEIVSVRFEPGVKAPDSLMYLFSGCASLTQVDFSGLDTSATTLISGMFWDCTSLQSIDLSSLDLSQVDDMSNLFMGCTSLTDITLGAHDMPNMRFMNECFSGCTSLRTIDLSGLSVNSGADFSGMFENCSIESFSVGATYPIWKAGAIPSTPKEVRYPMWYSAVEQKAISPSALSGRRGIADTYTLSLTNLGDAQVELDGHTYNADDNTYEAAYTGSAITPDPTTVALNGKTLVRGVDYTVSYYDNVNAGNGSMIFSGIGTYSGTLRMVLRIKATDWGESSSDDLSVEMPETAVWDASVSKSYSGANVYLPPVTVVFKGKTLQKDTDYLVDYEPVLGESVLKIYGMGNYTGVVERSFTLEQFDLADAVVYATRDGARYGDDELELAYNGSPITPSITVEDSAGAKMPSGSYTLTYENNSEVGTAQVLVESASDFCKGSKRYTFSIATCDLSSSSTSCEIVVPETSGYTGAAVEPEPTVTLGGKTLIRDTDYTVAYSNNVEPGTATVTITGVGGFTGSKSATFEIVKQSIEGAVLTVSSTSFAFNGKVQKPSVKTVGGKELVAGTDYTAVYSNAASTNAGSYTVAVEGMGAYVGTSASVTYTINRAANPMKVKATKATVTVKYAKVKSKAQTLKSNVKFTTKGKGTIKYANASSGKVKKWKVNAKTGKITVPKKTKKGTYKIKIKVTAAGDGNYAASTKYVSYKIKVK